MIKSKEKFKRDQGITLIALVITIIVLLILAGVTIATLFGENGILTKATEASEETEIAQEKEEVRLAYTAAKANKENYEELVTDAEMNDELDKLNSTGTASGAGTLTVIFESGREYTINQETGEITGPEETLTEDELKEKLEQVEGDAFIDENGNIFDTDKYETLVTDEDNFSIGGNYDWYEGIGSKGYYGDIIEGNLEYEIPAFMKQGNQIYKLTSIGEYTFFSCTELTNVIIPDSVTSIEEGAFRKCENLTNINLPKELTSIGRNAFAGCIKLANITIPDSVTSIGYGAFDECESLTNINIPKKVTSIGSRAFEGCVNLTNIIIPDSVISIGGNAFDRTPWYDNKPDGSIYIGKVYYEYRGEMPLNTTLEINDGTKSIAEGALNSCSGLVGVIIPDSLTKIGNSAFSNCVNLSNVRMSNKIEEIWLDAFSMCTSLTSIELPDSVTYISRAFDNCDNLKSIKINKSKNSVSGAKWGADNATVTWTDGVTE